MMQEIFIAVNSIIATNQYFNRGQTTNTIINPITVALRMTTLKQPLKLSWPENAYSLIPLFSRGGEEL